MEVLNLSPGHLMLTFWNVCHTIEAATSSLESPFALADLLTTYSVRQVSLGKVTLKVKPRYPCPVEGTVVSESIWKTRFFFITKDSLGEAEDFLPDG